MLYSKPTFSMFLTDFTRLSNSLKVAAGTGVVEKARTAALLDLTATRALEAAVLSMLTSMEGDYEDCW